MVTKKVATKKAAKKHVGKTKSTVLKKSVSMKKVAKKVISKKPVAKKKVAKRKVAKKTVKKAPAKKKVAKTKSPAKKKVAKKAAKKRVARKKVTKKPKWQIEVSSEEQFYAADGSQLSSLLDLVKSFENMADHVFYHHVTIHNNDFANWVDGVFTEPKLAGELRSSNDKEEMQTMLLKFIVNNV